MALSYVEGVGPSTLRALLSLYGDATSALWSSEADLARHPEVSDTVRARLVSCREQVVSRAERDLSAALAAGDRVLCLGQEGYPRRLALCPDAPLVLHVSGPADLDAARTLAVVGTRRPTQEGQELAAEVVATLCERHPDILILSGLALGIDIAAHRAALAKGSLTAAVLAHGLHTIYPDAHRPDAAAMVEAGGALLTEHPRGARAEAHQFIERNRVVAGLADGVLVVESALRGGSMSAAARARDYHRTLMAVPGFPGREMSEGPNDLIRSGRAALVESAADVERLLGWTAAPARPEQPGLFASPTEQALVDTLEQAQGPLTAAEMAARTKIPLARATAALASLTFAGRLTALPGNAYQIQ